MTEVEEKNAKETDKVESALQRAIHITKLLIIWGLAHSCIQDAHFVCFLFFILFTEKLPAMNLSKLEHLYVE